MCADSPRAEYGLRVKSYASDCAARPIRRATSTSWSIWSPAAA